MGKPNKNKKAHNEPNSKIKIEEVEFKVESNDAILSPGEKKFLAQQERIRKEEEEERLKKENLEAEKKKKNNKTPNKTKTKQSPPKTKEESKSNSKPKNKEDYKPEVKPMNKEIENKPEVKPKATPNKNDANNSSFQETSKPKSEYNQEETNEVWPQENNSSSWDTEGDEAWSNNQNWRHEKREIAKPNYSNSRQSANNSFVRRSYNSSFSDGKNDEEFQKFLNSRGNFTGKVREEIGDLFNAPDDYSLAHCVAEDFSMGAGIAKEFKARFKRLGTLLDQNAKTGGLAILEDKDRYIYYLVTKARSRGKPTLHTLWRSLLKLRDHMVENNVTKLAIPQIGCGLDQLDWPKVKQMLEYVFSKNEVDIVVYILEYNATESPNPSKGPRQGYVVHKVQPLIDIQSETGLIFFGTEDGAVTHEMECLAKKFDFISKYKMRTKAIGDVVKIVDRNEYLYGLIIKRTIKNKINCADFEKCLFNLRKMLKTDQTVYIGLQGFVEQDDEIITDKLVNLMKYILPDVEIWVCWPKELERYCPQQK